MCTFDRHNFLSFLNWQDICDIRIFWWFWQISGLYWSYTYNIKLRYIMGDMGAEMIQLTRSKHLSDLHSLVQRQRLSRQILWSIQGLALCFMSSWLQLMDSSPNLYNKCPISVWYCSVYVFCEVTCNTISSPLPWPGDPSSHSSRCRSDTSLLVTFSRNSSLQIFQVFQCI